LQRFPDDVRARILLASDQASAGETDEAIMHEKSPWPCPNDANVLYGLPRARGIQA
jgi:hypothetical protein